MHNIIDVRKLLKQFGVFVYVGDRIADLSLMEDELKALHEDKVINSKDYMDALLVIKNERKDLE